MNFKFVKYLIIILLLANCGKQETEIKNYGFPKNESGSLNVSLELSEFKNYGNLIDRIREITCNDSIPRIVIKEENIVRNIYPIEHCEPMIFDPKGKHYVSLAKGKFYKDHFSKEIKMDSLAWTLKNDFAYFKVEDKTDVIKSYLMIFESNRNEKVDGIENFLTDLIQEYDKLKTELELNISFWEVVPYLPPPEMKNDNKTE
ncbi:hypothetical protein JCM19294_2 [Nonlabens tegetincola]|uniref:Uncharacterized protein n=1 Tax=Nonlabens tegetincola TaxID=323273 RepID=A0A090QPR6_9FLAO|nr:lipopolysaccharide core heptose(II) kinase RfaY [Nonlabens tegetincola]GAK97466.1 hypothetical protein JCM19294_2 [Nonlabens tegetincola]